MIATSYISSHCDLYDQIIHKLFCSYKKNSLSVLCGAGISFCDLSSLPSGKRLRDELAGIMVKCVKDYNITINYDRLKDLLKTKALEVVLDAFVRVFGREALSYIVNLDISEWNPNHKFIAKLAYYNDSFKIITLNFDVLIEKVLDTLESNYIIRCPLASDLNRYLRDTNTQVNIIKPHGSFPLPSERNLMSLHERVKNITTTLQDIRDKPDLRTIQLLKTALEKCSHLLVAGYSGEDWDIIPILDDLKKQNPNLKITWIKHPDELNIGDMTKRLMDKFDENSTIVIGDTFFLLRDFFTIVFPLEPVESKPTYDTPIKKMNTDLFFDNKPATILAVACLLEGTEERMINTLLCHLKQSAQIKRNHSWQQCYLNVVAWHAYTEHKHAKGIRKRKEALRINRKKLKKTNLELVEDLLGTGFQYLKYVGPRKPSCDWFILAPLYLLKGIYYLRRAEALSTSNFRKARAAYYRVDFLHGWALFLLLFGCDRIKYLRKAVFRMLNKQYEKVDQKYGDHMDREYFFLRKVETMVLSGMRHTNEKLKTILDKIQYIEDYFLLTDEIVHLRNICVTRAFLRFAENVHCKTIKRYLSWALKGYDRAAGLLIHNGKLYGDINGDRSINRISEYLKNPTDETKITKTAIARYTIFSRFFWPDEVSLMDVWHALKL